MPVHAPAVFLVGVIHVQVRVWEELLAIKLVLLRVKEILAIVILVGELVLAMAVILHKMVVQLVLVHALETILVGVIRV